MKKELKCEICQHEQPETYGHSQACSKWEDPMKELETPKEKSEEHDCCNCDECRKKRGQGEEKCEQPTTQN